MSISYTNMITAKANFSRGRRELLVPVCDAAFCKVVRREFDIYAVPHQNADAIATHAARDGGQDHVVRIVDLDFEKCVGLFVDHDAAHFDKFFFHILFEN